MGNNVDSIARSQQRRSAVINPAASFREDSDSASSSVAATADEVDDEEALAGGLLPLVSSVSSIRPLHALAFLETGMKQETNRWTSFVANMRHKVFSRTSGWRQTWFIMMLCVILYEVLVIPIRVAYAIDYDLWHYLEIPVDVILIMDMVVRSLVPYRRREKFISEWPATIGHYFCVRRGGGCWCFGWFFLDVLAVFPYYLFLWWIPPLRHVALGQVPLTLSLCKLPRLLLLVHLGGFFPDVESSLRKLKVKEIEGSEAALTRIMKWAIYVIVLGHLTACSFDFLLTYHGTEDERVRFANALFVSTGKEDLGGLGTVGGSPLSFLGVLSRYSLAFYWAVMTMTGYGGTMPITDIQTWYSLVVVTIGVGAYVVVIGIVGSMVTNFDVAAAAYREKLDSINDYMRYRNVKRGLRSDIRRYYHYLWNSRKGLDEATIIESLPYYLRVSVALFLHYESLKKFVLFSKVRNPSFLREILVHLIPSVSYPNSAIIRQGDTGNEMYFLMKGEAEVVVGANLVVWQFGPGSFFGEIALLEKMRRTATVRAKTFCDLFLLKKSDFEVITTHFPVEAAVVRETARERLEQTKKKKGESKKKERDEARKQKEAERQKMAEEERRLREEKLMAKLNEASRERADLNARRRRRRRKSRRSSQTFSKAEILQQLREV